MSATRDNSTRGHDRGAIVIEFALVALILYVLLAGTVALGRMVHGAQVAQDAARLLARELSLEPLPPGMTFAEALADPNVRSRIYDPDRLVVDLDQLGGRTLDEFFAVEMPLVNRALRPAMIFEEVLVDGALRRLVRMPGALLRSATSPAGLTVGVPLVTSRDPSTGTETIRWLAVVEEVRDPSDPTSGPFSVLSTGPDQGVVAVRVNIPVQAAGMSGFRQSPEGPFEPNIANVNLARDADVATDPLSGPPPGAPLESVSSLQGASPYEGPYGLGVQFALGTQVRPFRRVVTGQAIFRREVFSQP